MKSRRSRSLTKRLFFRRRWWWIGLLALGLAGCGAAVLPPPTSTPVPPPSATPRPLPPTPTPADTGWATLRPGLEEREMTAFTPEGAPLARLYLLRLEPARHDFRLAYRPGEPQSLAAWGAETGASLLVNGGFFTEEYVATGLVIIDGVPSGVSYRDFGGMAAITAAGIEIWSLAERPYAPDPAIRYAFQSFPMLVNGGQAVYREEGGPAARRSAMALDGNGRVLFILTRRGELTLAQLSHFLAADGLGLQTALNLDGGASAGLLLADPPRRIPALSPLPLVIVGE